jgi:hypothetical protein
MSKPKISVRFSVCPSRNQPGCVSIRPLGMFYNQLTAQERLTRAGFLAGDEVEVRLVRRPKPRKGGRR